jgi:hypothetical protein
MRAAVTHLVRGLGGCGCGFVVFFVALAFTGSFGFQRSTLEGPVFVVAVIVGLAAPIIAVIFLVREIVLAIVKRPARSDPHMTGGTPETGPPAETTRAEIQPRVPASSVWSTPTRALLALIFVVVSGIYLWTQSDPVARGQVDWGLLLRAAVIGFGVGWFLRPWQNARHGRQTTPRERLVAGIGVAGFVVMVEVLTSLIAAVASNPSQ